MGRNMFGPIRGPWADEEWTGWWGDEPPYHHPVFVLTHHPRPPITMEGGTDVPLRRPTASRRRWSRRFEAAGGLDVRLGGGAADRPAVPAGRAGRRAAPGHRAGPARRRRAALRRPRRRRPGGLRVRRVRRVQSCRARPAGPHLTASRSGDGNGCLAGAELTTPPAGWAGRYSVDGGRCRRDDDSNYPACAVGGETTSARGGAKCRSRFKSMIGKDLQTCRFLVRSNVDTAA